MSDVYLCFMSPSSTSNLRLENYTRREHLGLGYIHSVLKQNDIDVKIVDADYFDLSANQLSSIVKSPKLVGFSVFVSNIEPTINAIKLIKARFPNCHINIGGILPSYYHREFLLNIDEIDSVSIGEGEGVFLSLAQAVLNADEYRNIDGIAYRKESCISVNSGSIPIDLDSLPFPEREYYYKNSRYRPDVATLVSSRGCYGNCTFCLSTAYYREFAKSASRDRNVENVIEEVNLLSNYWGFECIAFMDLNLITPNKRGRQRLIDLATGISGLRNPPKFVITCRANDIVKCEDIFPILKEAGLMALTFGIESTNERQLELYNKGYKKNVVEEAVRILDGLDIGYRTYNIMFDKKISVRELIQNLKDVGRYGASKYYSIFNKVSPRVGTKLFNDMDGKGELVKTIHHYTKNTDVHIPHFDYEFDEEGIGEIFELGGKFEHGIGRALEKLYDVDYSAIGLNRLIYFGIERIAKNYFIERFTEFVQSLADNGWISADKVLDQIMELLEHIASFTKELGVSSKKQRAVIKGNIGSSCVAILIPDKLLIELDSASFGVIDYLYEDNICDHANSKVLDEIRAELSSYRKIAAEKEDGKEEVFMRSLDH